jgi:hypothetical protein
VTTGLLNQKDLNPFAQCLGNAFKRKRGGTTEGIYAGEKLMISWTFRHPPWNDLKGQIFLGDQRFIEGVKTYCVLDDNLKEVPRFQRDADRPSLAMLFDNVASHDMPARNRAIHAAHVVHHYTLKEVGDHMSLHYTTVSRIIREQHRMLQRKT